MRVDETHVVGLLLGKRSHVEVGGFDNTLVSANLTPTSLFK